MAITSAASITAVNAQISPSMLIFGRQTSVEVTAVEQKKDAVATASNASLSIQSASPPENKLVAATASQQRPINISRPPVVPGDSDLEIDRIRVIENGVGVTQDLEKAFTLYQRAAKRGNLRAHVDIGRLLLDLKSPIATDQALRHFTTAAKGGDADALAWQGWANESGVVSSRGGKAALELYRAAAEKGSTWAAYKVGVAYQRGALGLTASDSDAISWHTRAATAYYAPSILELSWIYDYTPTKARDKAKAVEMLRLAAKLGNPTALYLLGLKYATGDGVVKDYANANEYYERAANLGEFRAQNNLGAHYIDGLGVPKDLPKGIAWMRKSAVNGNTMAMNTLGTLYEFGKGVERNYSIALDWYRSAAELGEASAQKSVGVMYELGRGIPRDVEVARDWYRKAVTNGYSDATYMIANTYSDMKEASGYAEAAKWLRKGVQMGSAGAMNNLAAAILLGNTQPIGEENAVELLKRAAQLLDAVAMGNMGTRYVLGRDVAQDYPKGVALLQDAAARGDANATRFLARLYASGHESVGNDIRRAIKMLSDLPEQDDEATLLLGRIALSVPQLFSADERDREIVRLQRVAKSPIKEDSTIALTLLAYCTQFPDWKNIDIESLRVGLHALADEGDVNAAFSLMQIYARKSWSLIRTERGMQLLKQIASADYPYASLSQTLLDVINIDQADSLKQAEFFASLGKRVLQSDSTAMLMVAGLAAPTAPEQAAAIYRELVKTGAIDAQLGLCKLLLTYTILPKDSKELQSCRTVP